MRTARDLVRATKPFSHEVRALTKEPTLDNRWQPAAFTPDGKALIANRGDVGSTTGSVWRLSLADGAAKRLDSAPRITLPRQSRWCRTSRFDAARREAHC